MQKTQEREEITLQDGFASKRECTRCDGDQFLLGTAYGIGKYVCDTCEMRVGFDVESLHHQEYLLHRGLPHRYTKDIFGKRLSASEVRFNPQLVRQEIESS